MRELSLHILDLLQNALEAGASYVELEIVEDIAQNRLSISVEDNGRGMSKEALARIDDPFFTTRRSRRVGLGIPLLKAAARRCNGDVSVTSKMAVGTRVEAHFERDHIDRAPLGDMVSTLSGFILTSPAKGEACDMRYTHRIDGRTFTFDTREIRETLGGVPLTHPRVRRWMEDFLQQGFAELHGNPSF
ncbi:MAG: ATP-binding protein [Anaerolineales bacterium]